MKLTREERRERLRETLEVLGVCVFLAVVFFFGVGWGLAMGAAA